MTTLELPAPVGRLDWLASDILAVAGTRRRRVAAPRRDLPGSGRCPAWAQWLAFAPAPTAPSTSARGLPSPARRSDQLVAHSLGADTELTYGLVHLGFVAAAVAALVAVGRQAVGDAHHDGPGGPCVASPLSRAPHLARPARSIVFGGLTVVALASALTPRSASASS